MLNPLLLIVKKSSLKAGTLQGVRQLALTCSAPEQNKPAELLAQGKKVLVLLRVRAGSVQAGISSWDAWLLLDVQQPARKNSLRRAQDMPDWNTLHKLATGLAALTSEKERDASGMGLGWSKLVGDTWRDIALMWQPVAQGIAHVRGVPIGTKLVRVSFDSDELAKNEFIIAANGTFISQFGATTGIRAGLAIITPDNVYGVLNLAGMPMPEGYELDGETLEAAFRYPTRRDFDTGQYFIRCPRDDGWSTDTPVGMKDDTFNLIGDIRRICIRPVEPVKVKTKKVLVIECADPGDAFMNQITSWVQVELHEQNKPVKTGNVISAKIEEREV